jgi:transposase
MDQAGWHLSGKLTVPANMTLVPLPPYSPEINPIERFWQHLKDRWLSNRIFETLDDVLDACCEAWDAALAEPGTISSVSACSWTKV